jgi:uncharacterized protein (TIGR00369 family)
MKKIRNPYDNEVNMCFGCGKKNPIGLKLQFLETGKELRASWQPSETYQGYPNILHGGIIATLLDEIGAWCVSVKIGTAGVTSEMTIKFLHPVYINRGAIGLEAEIAEQTERSAKIICRLSDGTTKLCAEATAVYSLFPPEVAKRKYRYPGREAFYESDPSTGSF